MGLEGLVKLRGNGGWCDALVERVLAAKLDSVAEGVREHVRAYGDRVYGRLRGRAPRAIFERSLFSFQLDVVDHYAVFLRHPPSVLLPLFGVTAEPVD